MSTNTKLAEALRDLLMFCAENDANQGDPDSDHPSVTAAMSALAAHDAEQAQEPVALTPEWLWVQLMDWCKRRGSNPSEYNDLFRIVMNARAFLAAAPAPEARAEQAQQFDDLDLALIRKLRRCAWAVAKGDPVKDYLDEDDVVDSVRLLLQVIGPNVEGLITKDCADFDTWFCVVQSEVMERVGFDYQNKDAARAEYEDGYPANFLADDIAEEEESTRNLDDARAAYAARMACMPWRLTK